MGRALWRGESWAVWILAAILGAILIGGFVSFARRPLGGDPEKPPIDDSTFQDDNNPYRS